MDDQHFGTAAIPPEFDERIRSELRDNERLLWVGWPRPSRFLLLSLPIVLFGIPWTAFAVFWVIAASGMMFAGFGNANGGNAGFGGLFACFPLFGVPFVLIGLGMLSSPYWRWRQAKRTCYALTDKRAILWESKPFGGFEVRSYGSEALRKVVRTEYSDGCGDLIFEEIIAVGRDSDGDRKTTTTRRGFIAIEKVRDVEELLRATFNLD